MRYTIEQVGTLRSWIKQAKTKAEVERGRALLTLAKGKKRSEVAEIFEIHRDTLDRWQTAFMRSGITGIANKGYPGNHYKLTKEQKEQIKTLVSTKNPYELGLSDKRFWTTKLLKQLIKQEFGLVYESDATYRKLFYAFGFSSHKPGKHNRNQRPQEVERFRVAVKKRSDNTRGWAVWYW
ncbi:MAG TPA: winged helix-turn-helix domain-containing protein [Patescibacteria group bacterium]|nr:winged helix-turn-helix domain-containing protein [Patescibacteria group bacterium]